MNPCFGDTSYYLALLIPQDANHLAARKLSSSLRRRVVTSEFVILEVGNYLSATPARNHFAAFLQSLRADSFTTIVPATSGLLGRGIDLYVRRPDKSWSVIDCISFVIMEDQGLSDGLTADHHFEQAGFNVMLK